MPTAQTAAPDTTHTRTTAGMLKCRTGSSIFKRPPTRAPLKQLLLPAPGRLVLNKAQRSVRSAGAPQSSHAQNCVHPTPAAKLTPDRQAIAQLPPPAQADS